MAAVMMLMLALSVVTPSHPDLARATQGRADYLGLHHLNNNQASRLATAAIKAAERFDVSTSLIIAVIEIESSYGPSEKSSANCIGLMQLNPYTAAEVAKDIGLAWYELRNIENNVLLGTAYLRSLFDRYGRWDYALTAYNRGPGFFEKSGRKVSGYARQVLARQVVITKLLASS